MLVAAAVVELRIHGCQSLKQKRGVVRSIAKRVQNRFQIAVAEVDGQDTWQRAVLGLAAVGTDAVRLRGLLQRVFSFIEETHLAEFVVSDVEIVDLPLASFASDFDEEPDDLPPHWTSED